MNKTEFLEQLERLLADISRQEREEALDFYRSYFEDAGEENEAQVIQELGSPGKVAAIIKADLEESREETREEHGEYTESGYQDERFREDHVPEKAQERTGNSENTEDSGRSQQGPYSNYRYTGREHRHQKSGISWPLIIVIGLSGNWRRSFRSVSRAVFGNYRNCPGLVFRRHWLSCRRRCRNCSHAAVSAFPACNSDGGGRYQPDCTGYWNSMYSGLYLAGI